MKNEGEFIFQMSAKKVVYRFMVLLVSTVCDGRAGIQKGGCIKDQWTCMLLICINLQAIVPEGFVSGEILGKYTRGVWNSGVNVRHIYFRVPPKTGAFRRSEMTTRPGMVVGRTTQEQLSSNRCSVARTTTQQRRRTVTPEFQPLRAYIRLFVLTAS